MTRHMTALVCALLLACNGQQPPVTTVKDALDPELYRPNIVLLDAMIYENGPIGNEQQLLLAESVGRLAQDIGLEEEFPATAATLAEELDSLYFKVQESGTSRHMEDSGIREKWGRIRDTYFEAASWFRRNPDDPVAHIGQAGPRMDPATGQLQAYVRGTEKLGEALMTLLVLATTEQKDLRVNKEEELARLDSLFNAPSLVEDVHYQQARAEARETMRYLREYIASGHDTIPGSPGRIAMEKMVEHLSAAEEALEKAGS